MRIWHIFRVDSFLHVSAVQGDTAERKEPYNNTVNEYRKVLTQQCAASDGGVYGFAVKQASAVQGGS